MGVDAAGSKKLYYHVVWVTVMDMKAAKINNVKDHWVQWMTHKNLKLWFENWGKDLVELGFAHHDKHGEVIIPDDLLLVVDEAYIEFALRPDYPDLLPHLRDGRPNLPNPRR